MGIATEAIDRLHSTAHSHHRIIVVEVMGHRAGWLALGAGVAGGADVILIPEIPYDTELVAAAILRRSRGDKQFSIVAVAEGAMSAEDAEGGGSAARQTENEALVGVAIEPAGPPQDAGRRTIVRTRTITSAAVTRSIWRSDSRSSPASSHGSRSSATSSAAARRRRPIAFSRRRLGTACARLIHSGKYGVMVAARGEGTSPVPLGDVAGKRKTVPLDHPWIVTARQVGTCLGDS